MEIQDLAGLVNVLYYSLRFGTLQDLQARTILNEYTKENYSDRNYLLLASFSFNNVFTTDLKLHRTVSNVNTLRGIQQHTGTRFKLPSSYIHH